MLLNNLKYFLSEQEEEVDVDRIYWDDNYALDVALKHGYKEDTFNDRFWQAPMPLYHLTQDEPAELIREGGLVSANKSRGLSNRSVGSAIFTVSDWDSAAYLKGSYGNNVFEINTQAMKRDGYTPYVSREPAYEEAGIKAYALRAIGEEDVDESSFIDSSDGLTPDTVIIHGDVPLKYIEEV